MHGITEVTHGITEVTHGITEVTQGITKVTQGNTFVPQGNTQLWDYQSQSDFRPLLTSGSRPSSVLPT